MKKVFPIIHIIGLPGAGKTTLGKKLSRTLDLPVYRVGEYRRSFQSLWWVRQNAWVALFRDLSKQK